MCEIVQEPKFAAFLEVYPDGAFHVCADMIVSDDGLL